MRQVSLDLLVPVVQKDSEATTDIRVSLELTEQLVFLEILAQPVELVQLGLQAHRELLVYQDLQGQKEMLDPLVHTVQLVDLEPQVCLVRQVLPGNRVIMEW